MQYHPLNKSGITTTLLTIASSIILIPSFLLLMASSWCGDDYRVAKTYQIEGLSGLHYRIFAWSPRFFSETVLYFYYKAVPLWEKPFTGAIILIVWLFLIFSIFAFIRNIIKKHSLYLQKEGANSADIEIVRKGNSFSIGVVLPLLITLVFFIYLLYAQRPNTMFYVVVISVAYISVLIGILFNLNFLINKSNAKNIASIDMAKLAIFGFITASSWEMGAVYQLLFCACFLLLLILSFVPIELKYLPFSNLRIKDKCKLLITNLVTLSFTLYILFLLVSNRVGATVEIENIDSPLIGNFKASFVNTVWQFFREVLFLNHSAGEPHTYSNFYSFSYSVFLKLSLFALFTILFYRAKIRLDRITINAAIFAIAPLVVTNFAITFASYYQLGTTDIPRQLNFKAGTIGLIIVIISAIAASIIASQKDKNSNFKYINLWLNSHIILLINFGLTLTLLINLQLSHIEKDLINLPKMIVSNRQNWQVNLDPNSSFAVYTQIPLSYVYRMHLDDGFYPSCDNINNITALRYANYFNKKKLYATPFESQNTKNSFAGIFQEISTLNSNINVYFDCDLAYGNIDIINNIRDPDRIINLDINEPVEILGWAINPDRNKAERIIITTENEQNVIANLPVNISRPDVAGYLKNSDLIDSGWKAQLIPDSEWRDKIIKFKVWTYNPKTKLANFYKQFTLSFSDRN